MSNLHICLRSPQNTHRLLNFLTPGDKFRRSMDFVSRSPFLRWYSKTSSHNSKSDLQQVPGRCREDNI